LSNVDLLLYLTDLKDDRYVVFSLTGRTRDVSEFSETYKN